MGRRKKKIRKLIVKPVYATVQEATVQIPFTIEMTSDDIFFDRFRKLLGRWWCCRQKEIPKTYVRGRVDFYDKEHGHLDGKGFIVPKLFVRMKWRWFNKFFLGITGVMPNIGRFCFTGWGEVKMDVDGDYAVFSVNGRFDTFIVKKV